MTLSRPASDFVNFIWVSSFQMNQISSYNRFSRYRLYQLIQRTPKLLVSYFWSNLQELDNESLSSVVSILGTTANQNSTCRKSRQSSQRKYSEAPHHGSRVNIWAYLYNFLITESIPNDSFLRVYITCIMNFTFQKLSSYRQKTSNL